MQLRDFVKKSRKKIVRKPVATDYEIARILYENQDTTVLFEKVRSSKFKVVGNVLPSREAICAALRCDKSNYINRVVTAVENPIEPKIVTRAPCFEVEETSLHDLPILRHFERDAGRYITSGIVIARDVEYGRNVSVHRMLVRGERKLGIRLVERHLYAFYQRAEQRGEPLDVAIAIGVAPEILFAASYSPPLGYDELRLASSLAGKPVELVKCKSVNLEVPADAEIVIEGKMLPHAREDEGPFADVTGTYDIVRKQPVIELTHISHRRNPIYHALLPSSIEHRLLMGMPQEPRIYASVAKVAEVKNVCLTEGGCNWLHGVVAIKKRSEEDAKRAISAALEGHPSMKHVVIVDEDVDIFNPAEVEFAIATRFQADKDAIIIPNVKGSSLDPSANKTGSTTKVGVNATKPLGREEEYKKAEIPRG